MNKPFFSVIMPTHNGEEYIRKSLESIRVQTFTDYELIIVCDKCDDNTEAIAREYTDKVFVIDAGRCALARNKGLDEATGEWILFIDDDDWFMDSMVFQTIADTVGKQGEDVLAFSFFWKGHGVARNRKDHLWTAVWNKCWRREFIERIGARFPDWAHSDDDGFSKFCHPKAKIAFLDQCLYFYNFMREGSLTWQIENGLISGDFPGKNT